MEKVIAEIDNYLNKNKKHIAELLSKLIKIKSYSGKEDKVAWFIFDYLKKNVSLTNITLIRKENNVIVFLNKTKNSKKIKFLFDAHIDTIPAENNKDWKYPPFSGKIINGKIYGRGSCDDKSSVAALIFTILTLSKLNYNKSPQAFSFSSNEEDSSAKGIEKVLEYVEPQYCIICEPSDLKIVYGHKGKWCVKITFYGIPAHSSLPQYGKNAVYSAYPIIKNIIEKENKNFIDSPLGKPTYNVTYIETKTNSLNSIPHECSVYIDYRSVLGETEQKIRNFILQGIKEKQYEFVPQHRFFPAWILDTNHPLLKLAKQTYKKCFNKETTPLLWQFCTNGSITMAKYKIPTIGFGAGNPFLAHSTNEYVKIKDVLNAIKFYTILCLTQ